ncbi:hypothetical protein GQ457_15G009290 [Hibiscus cannabinus]
MQCFLLPVTFCDDINAAISRFWWKGAKESDKGIHWIKWSDLCMAKKKGGLGFKDLRTFNRALIAKQAWRLINNPNSLVCRILKGKYFPDVDILSASGRSNPSWAWRSISDGIDTIKKGSLWRVGNGKDIQIWFDKWIPNSESTSNLHRPSDCLDFHVFKLINFETREWDMEKIQNWFPKEIGDKIQAIPIGGPDSKDKLIWPFCKNGEYTVKSGYHFLVDHLPNVDSPTTSVSSQNDPFLWKSIWTMNVPPKIKHFIWRACRNAIASKCNIKHRLKIGNDECPRCGEDSESLEHILFFAHLHKLFGRRQISVIVRNVLVSPGSVNARNAFVFTGVDSDPSLSWLLAHDAFMEFSQINILEPSRLYQENGHNQQCTPTPPDCIKINCDASFINFSSSAAGAAVFRDSHGKIVKVVSKSFRAFSASMAEALAVRMGVSFAFRCGFPNIIVESDNIGLISRLKTKSFSAWDSALIEADIINLTTGFSSVSFSHVSRLCNRQADWVARSTRVGNYPVDWVSAMPRDFVSHCNCLSL